MHRALRKEYRNHARYQAAIQKFGEITPFVRLDELKNQRITALQTLMRAHDIEIIKNEYVNVGVSDSILAVCTNALDIEKDTYALYEVERQNITEYNDLYEAFATFATTSLQSNIPALERCIEERE